MSNLSPMDVFDNPIATFGAVKWRRHPSGVVPEIWCTGGEGAEGCHGAGSSTVGPTAPSSSP